MSQFFLQIPVIQEYVGRHSRILKQLAKLQKKICKKVVQKSERHFKAALVKFELCISLHVCLDQRLIDIIIRHRFAHFRMALHGLIYRMSLRSCYLSSKIRLTPWDRSALQDSCNCSVHLDAIWRRTEWWYYQGHHRLPNFPPGWCHLHQARKYQILMSSMWEEIRGWR